MKSYGTWDLSWSEGRVRDMLEDASRAAKKGKEALFIRGRGEEIVLVPEQDELPGDVPICGVRTREVLDHWKGRYSRDEIRWMLAEEFWDSYDDIYTYAIDEMVPKVYGFVRRGTKIYEDVENSIFARENLMGMVRDAARLRRLHSKVFIVGRTKKHDMAVAPVSRRSRFLDHMAWVVAESGVWTISGMHSDRVEKPESALYSAISDKRKQYGRLGDDADACITMLESAFEDAVRMSARDDIQYSIRISKNGTLSVGYKTGAASTGHRFLWAEPEDFIDGSTILYGKIASAARESYGWLQDPRRRTPYSTAPRAKWVYVGKSDKGSTARGKKWSYKGR